MKSFDLSCEDAQNDEYTILWFGNRSQENIGQVSPLPFLFVYMVIWQPCKHCHSESINKQISDVTYKALERHSFCFYLAPQRVFICLWNLDLSFASCTSCTSAMHNITQL